MAAVRIDAVVDALIENDADTIVQFNVNVKGKQVYLIASLDPSAIELLTTEATVEDPADVKPVNQD